MNLKQQKLWNKLNLYNHQIKMIDFATNGKAIVNIFADVGTGKTRYSLALAVKYPNLKFLILVHKKSMIQEWFIEQKEIFGKILPNVMIRAYTQKLALIKHDVLIIDEIHKLKGMGTRFANIVRHLQFRKVICLTATPIDSLNDIYFYWLMQNQDFLTKARATLNQIVKYEDLLKVTKETFTKMFAPKEEKYTYINQEGNEEVKKQIIGFTNEEKLKDIFLNNSIFVKNYKVIKGIEKFTVKNFTPVDISIDSKEIEKIKNIEEKRRYDVNEENMDILANYKENQDKIKSMIQSVKYEQDLEHPNEELITNFKIKIKELQEENKKYCKIIYPKITVTPKWLNDKINGMYDFNQMKLNKIEKNSIIIHFFKNSEKYLHVNLKNWTNDPYKFIKGGYDYLVCHASTVAEGINGIQKITTNVLFFDLEQSRLRVEQLIGRVNRVGKIDKVKISYFEDKSFGSKAWKNTFSKPTFEEWLLN